MKTWAGHGENPISPACYLLSPASALQTGRGNLFGLGISDTEMNMRAGAWACVFMCTRLSRGHKIGALAPFSFAEYQLDQYLCVVEVYKVCVYKIISI